MSYTSINYNQFNENERFLIDKLFKNGLSMRFIAKKLRTNLSRISWEIKRNIDLKGNYEYSFS